MNIGIVGPGRVAARFAQSINTMPNATLFGVCGRTPASVEDFINKTNSIVTRRVYTALTLMNSYKMIY